MHAFLFVLEIEPHDLNAEYNSLPLHCTLMPWFRCTHGFHSVVEASSSLFLRAAPVTVTATEFALFGPMENVPVYRVERTHALSVLHAELLAALSNMSAEHLESRYVGEGYNPHVTSKGDKMFPTGSAMIATSVSLVEALDPIHISDKVIRHRFVLSN